MAMPLAPVPVARTPPRAAIPGTAAAAAGARLSVAAAAVRNDADITELILLRVLRSKTVGRRWPAVAGGGGDVNWCLQ